MNNLKTDSCVSFPYLSPIFTKHFQAVDKYGQAEHSALALGVPYVSLYFA